MGELAKKAIQMMDVDEKNRRSRKPRKEPQSIFAGVKVESPKKSQERGNCEACRAGGYWEGHGEGLWCFYDGVFLGRSEPARPVTDELRANCPRREYKGKS